MSRGPVRDGRMVPVGPGVDEWRAMTPDARETFLVSVLDALSDPRDAMTEGRPHKKAKTRAIDLLGLHFRAKDKVVYLAEEMAVVYPGEVAFSPDVLAVLDVEEPEDDPRLAWVVADEGIGLDFVLEVLHRGDRKKDLVDNVARYARLGIPEYFVFDKARDEVLGYALSSPGSERYTRIVPQRGRHPSRVLGVDLAVEGGKLRFFDGMAELFGTSTLLERLTEMMATLEQKAEEERTRTEEERTRAEEERTRAEEERTRAEEERTRAEWAVGGLRDAVGALLDVRGIAIPDEIQRRLRACEDVATLKRWLLLATTAQSADEVVKD